MRADRPSAEAHGVVEARAVLAARRAGRPWPSLVVLLGAGKGHALDVIEHDAPAGTRVLVIEPLRVNAEALLARPDRRDRLKSGALRVLVGPEYAGAADAWRSIDPDGAAPLIVPDMALVTTHPNELLAARRVFDRVFMAAHENAKARKAFAGRYLVNTLRNVPRMLKAPDLRAWMGSRKRLPAVVCGAGPSLNRNLEQLAAHRDRIVLVAADTALRPILEAGLDPDFVVALDPTPLNARHLSGLGGLTRAWLISESAVDASAFDSFVNRTAFFRVANHDPWPWLKTHGLDTPVLAAWGSVLTSAFEFTAWLGCDPIMFMGADLSYADGQPYCRGTMFEADWARVVLAGQTLPQFWQRIVARKSSGPVPGVGNTSVETSAHLLSFRDWFVERAAKNGRRVVNLSGSGVLVGPAIEQGPCEQVAQFPSITLDSRPPVAAAALSVIDAIATAAHLSAEAAPMTGWLSRCRPNLDEAALTEALSDLRSAHRGITTDHGHRTGVRALVALPEAVAIVRAVREGAALPAWAVDSKAWSYRSRTRPSLEATLKALFELDSLTGAEIEPSVMKPVAGHLELLFELGLRQDTFETVAALVIETASALRDIPRGQTLTAARGGRPQPARLPLPALSPDMRARLFVASLWALANAVRAGDRAWHCLVDAIDAALSPESCDDSHSAATLSLAAQDGKSWQAAVQLSVDQRAKLLRGALLENRDGGTTIAHTTGGVRLALEMAGQALAGWAPFRVLTDEGLPKCLIANPLGSDRAIVTPRGEHASVIVDGDGRFTRGDEWPHPITGEVHGPGGAIAWTCGTPAGLMCRDASGEVVFEPIDFQVYTATWIGDDVILTGSTGVWSWRPGRPPRNIAAVPPGVIVSQRDRLLSIDPLPLIDGRLARQRMMVGWDVEIDAGTVTERVLDSSGQRWTQSVNGVNVATTFPEADGIRLTRAAGEGATWLVWSRPRAVIWLGPSLLVNTTFGEVALFPELAAR